METQVYLGTGLKYPIELSNGRVLTLSGYPLIDQSIIDILQTPVGSRLFLREYGSRLDELKFEPNDDILEGTLEMLIAEAIQTWESRTEFIDCSFQTDNDASLITIFHRPLPSNEIQSFVFPFYRELKY
jgi:phage baseplate assembly protein W